MSGEPDNLTPPGGWKATFLDVLRASPNVSAAARAAGVARQSAYEAREADPEFAAAWEDAIEESVDDLEAEAFRRARGVEVPIVNRQGELVGHRVEASDPLAIFLLKAHRRAKYGTKIENEHSGEVKVIVEYESDDPPYADQAPPGPGGAGEVDG